MKKLKHKGESINWGEIRAKVFGLPIEREKAEAIYKALIAYDKILKEVKQYEEQ